MNKTLKDLKLSELRELYPNLVANSKDKMIALIEKELESENVWVNPELKDGGENVIKKEKVNDDNLSVVELISFLEVIAKTNNKALIKCQSSMDADAIYTMLVDELLPTLNEDGINVVSSSSRRDFHINGTCYVRLVCKNNHSHMAQLIKYNVFKEVE